MLLEAQNLFVDIFRTDTSWSSFAPGRVNLVGDHTDYNDGFVFPAAIDRGVWLRFAPTKGSTTLTSHELGDGEPFDVNTVEPGQVSGWARYPAGVAWALRPNGALPNLQGAVASDLPFGSGLSSSAAIEMAFAVAWNELAGLGLSNQELALICQKAENEFVGMNCGVMDQLASALGKEGHALFLDTQSLETSYSPIPNGISIVVCDTGKKRELTSSGYNERRGQCEEACRLLGIPSLRQATKEQLEEDRDQLGDLLYRRALHVVTENELCQEFHKALLAKDLQRVGRLMAESHFSLRNNYEVSCIELDSMVQSVIGVIGCIGARMTGAGFGGACVALVHTEAVGEFMREADARYSETIGSRVHSFIECKAGSGARILPNVQSTGSFSENSTHVISRNTEDVE